MADDNDNGNDGNDGNDDAAAVAAVLEAGGEGGENEAPFHYAEGIAGDGEVPEWFKADKYKTVSEQAKAYTDLEGKFGSFTGSPEKFEVNLSEELTEQGIKILEDDPLMEEAIKFATDSNMSQDGFDSLMNLYAMSKVAEATALEENKAEEIKSLGANGEGRINNLISWGRANLPTDLFEGFEEMPKSASAVKALEKLVAMTRNAPISGDGNAAPGGITAEELTKMQFEKDEHGNRKLQTDPAFKARYEELRDQLYGTGDHRIVVGAK